MNQNQNLSSTLRDWSQEDYPFVSIKKGREAVVEALVLPGKLRELHIAIQNLRSEVSGVQSIVYEDIEYQQDWTKTSIDKIINVRLEYKQLIGFQNLMNVDENQLVDETNDLFSSRYCLNNMMLQKGPRLMFFVNNIQQLQSDVKIREIQGTVTDKNIYDFLTFQGFNFRRKEITSGILYPFEFGEEILIYRRRLKQISRRESIDANMNNGANLNPGKLDQELNGGNNGKEFLVMDENIDDDGDDDDVSENEEDEVNKCYYYCIVFKKQIGSNEQDEVGIEKVINFFKCFQDYLIVYKREK